MRLSLILVLSPPLMLGKLFSLTAGYSVDLPNIIKQCDVDIAGDCRGL